MTINGFNLLQIGIACYQHAVLDRLGQFAHNREAGLLQQIVNVVDRAGTGVFNRQHRVISLAVFNLTNNILKLQAADLHHIVEVARGILTCGEMGIGTFRAKESDARRQRMSMVQVFLQQRLLRQDGIFNDLLKQARDVVRIQLMFLAKHDQVLQQRTLAFDIANRPVRGQFRFGDLYGQRATLSQQRQQFLINGADLVTQRQQGIIGIHRAHL